MEVEWKARMDEIRPKGEYFKQSMGDFFLFLTKVDQLDYNILEEEENIKKKYMEEELSGVQNNVKSTRWFNLFIFIKLLLFV